MTLNKHLRSVSVSEQFRKAREILYNKVSQNVPPEVLDAAQRSNTKNIRRFVMEYPYVENMKIDTKPADTKLTPVKASPEFVMRIAMKSAIEEANKPKKLNVDQKKLLRSGKYWDSYRKEEVDPESLSRRFVSVRKEISPGSKLYQLISVLRNISPNLVYVINNED